MNYITSELYSKRNQAAGGRAGDTYSARMESCKYAIKEAADEIKRNIFGVDHLHIFKAEQYPSIAERLKEPSDGGNGWRANYTLELGVIGGDSGGVKYEESRFPIPEKDEAILVFDGTDLLRFNVWEVKTERITGGTPADDLPAASLGAKTVAERVFAKGYFERVYYNEGILTLNKQASLLEMNDAEIVQSVAMLNSISPYCTTLSIDPTIEISYCHDKNALLVGGEGNCVFSHITANLEVTGSAQVTAKKIKGNVELWDNTRLHCDECVGDVNTFGYSQCVIANRNKVITAGDFEVEREQGEAEGHKL